MSSFGRSRDFLVYLAVLIPYQAIRLMPYPVVKGMARLCGGTMNLIPSIRNLVRANIRTAFPEYSETEVARVGSRSLYNLALNMAEDLTTYLQTNGIRVRYMHSDIGAKM